MAESTTVSVEAIESRLADAQGDVARLRGELREAVDFRDLLVFEAVDLWHRSGRAVARALAAGNEGEGFTPQGVHRILAGGPPPPPERAGHEALDG